MLRIRPLELADADRLAALETGDREILAMYDHPDDWFTPAGQRARIEALAPRVEAGVTHPFAILDDDGELAGTLFVNQVVRGRLQSAALGYWVSSSQRVLERNGLTRYGLAPRYLFIRGAWRDHMLFQRTVEDQAPASSSAGSTPRAAS